MDWKAAGIRHMMSTQAGATLCRGVVEAEEKGSLQHSQVFSMQQDVTRLKNSSSEVLCFLSRRSCFSHIVRSHHPRSPNKTHVQNLPSSSLAQASMIFSGSLYVLLRAVISSQERRVVQRVTRKLDSKHRNSPLLPA
ncbi:hypothetical protein mRhiFer1_008086 [Rhinolophus ferrumequinum]|uniref:Uncharacterized protein n=1 Tax=Rhinolophus ferrumequinum TaxID=59479 RepID=A0A7J7WQW6_RHIFE|nr:hypothetical protein mRhiFer1_008086 [Rhinolophus ferrumequinum]